MTSNKGSRVLFNIWLVVSCLALMVLALAFPFQVATVILVSTLLLAGMLRISMGICSLISKRRKYVYLFGYPWQALGTLVPMLMFFSVIVVAFLGIPSFICHNTLIILYTEGWNWKAFLSLMFAAPFFLVSAPIAFMSIQAFLIDLFQQRFHVSLKVYDRDCSMAIPDPRDERNHYGIHLAKNCQLLDKVLMENHLKPLRDFLEKEDEDGKFIYYSSSNGLELIKSLKALLQDQDVDSLLLNDLKKMEESLQRTEDFHLVLV